MSKNASIISLKSILGTKSLVIARERLRNSKKCCTFVGCIVCTL